MSKTEVLANDVQAEKPGYHILNKSLANEGLDMKSNRIK